MKEKNIGFFLRKEKKFSHLEYELQFQLEMPKQKKMKIDLSAIFFFIENFFLSGTNHQLSWWCMMSQVKHHSLVVRNG